MLLRVFPRSSILAVPRLPHCFTLAVPLLTTVCHLLAAILFFTSVPVPCAFSASLVHLTLIFPSLRRDLCILCLLSWPFLHLPPQGSCSFAAPPVVRSPHPPSPFSTLRLSSLRCARVDSLLACFLSSSASSVRRRRVFASLQCSLRFRRYSPQAFLHPRQELQHFIRRFRQQFHLPISCDCISSVQLRRLLALPTSFVGAFELFSLFPRV